jgi:hypothetical protein
MITHGEDTYNFDEASTPFTDSEDKKKEAKKHKEELAKVAHYEGAKELEGFDGKEVAMDDEILDNAIEETEKSDKKDKKDGEKKEKSHSSKADKEEKEGNKDSDKDSY